MLAMRLTPQGMPDTTFNGNGYRPLPFNIGTAGSRNDKASALHVLQDGRVLVAGYATGANGRLQPAVARVRADGIPDPTFDGGHAIDEGRIVYNLCVSGDCDAKLHDLDVLADGRMLLAGWYSRDDADPAQQFAALRVRPEGALDTTFRSPVSPLDGLSLVDLGIVAAQFPAAAIATDLLLQGENVVLAGTAFAAEPTPGGDFGIRLALARLGNGDAPLFVDSFESQ